MIGWLQLSSFVLRIAFNELIIGIFLKYCVFIFSIPFLAFNTSIPKIRTYVRKYVHIYECTTNSFAIYSGKNVM